MRGDERLLELSKEKLKSSMLLESSLDDKEVMRGEKRLALLSLSLMGIKLSLLLLRGLVWSSLTPTFRNKSPTMLRADILAEGVKGLLPFLSASGSETKDQC